MLIEVYVIADGLNIYHYSKDQSEDKFVKSTLTSGFLSAIQTFSLEARESEIEYFASKDEYFLFTHLGVNDRMLICVFEKNTKREDSDKLVIQIRALLANTHLATASGNIIDEHKNSILDNQLELMQEQYFSQKTPELIAEEVFNSNPSISSLRILNIENKTILFENARPKPLLKSEQISELYLLFDALTKLSERISTNQFEFMTIRGDSLIFCIYRLNNSASVCYGSGIMVPEKIMDNTLGLYNFADFANFANSYTKSSRKTILNSKLNEQGDLEVISGSLPSPMLDIFLSTSINALERFVSSHVRKSFTKCEIFIPSSDRMKIDIEKENNIYLVNISVIV